MSRYYEEYNQDKNAAKNVVWKIGRVVIVVITKEYYCNLSILGSAIIKVDRCHGKNSF